MDLVDLFGEQFDESGNSSDTTLVPEPSLANHADFKQVGPFMFVYTPLRILIEQTMGRRQGLKIVNPVARTVLIGNQKNWRMKMYPEYQWLIGDTTVWSPLYKEADEFPERNFYVMKQPPKSFKAMPSENVMLCLECRQFCYSFGESRPEDRRRKHWEQSPNCEDALEIECVGYMTTQRPSMYFIVVNEHIEDMISEREKNSPDNDSGMPPLKPHKPIVIRNTDYPPDSPPLRCRSVPPSKKVKFAPKKESSPLLNIPSLSSRSVVMANGVKVDVNDIEEEEDGEFTTTVLSSVDKQMRSNTTSTTLPITVEEILLFAIAPHVDENTAKRRIPLSLLEFLKHDLKSSGVETETRSLPAEISISDSSSVIQMSVRITRNFGKQLLFTLGITVHLQQTTTPFSRSSTDTIEVTTLTLGELCTALVVLSTTTKDILSRSKDGVEITRAQVKQTVARSLMKADLAQQCWPSVFRFLKGKANES